VSGGNWSSSSSSPSLLVRRFESVLVSWFDWDGGTISSLSLLLLLPVLIIDRVELLVCCCWSIRVLSVVVVVVVEEVREAGAGE